jgi:cytochrome c oxidase subunit III
MDSLITRRSTQRATDGGTGGLRPPRLPAHGGGGDGGRRRPPPPLSNARLGVFMLLAAEVMFFGGLIGAFLVLRLGALAWPPAGQPRLPIGVTAVNTAVLLLSSYTVARAVRAARVGEPSLSAWLGRTAGLGATFLAVQGIEWLRLIRFGLTTSSGVYGGTFYTLIGMHGLHVLAALTWVAFTVAGAARGRYRVDPDGVVACATYWHFVVALWPILYVLIYLV